MINDLYIHKCFINYDFIQWFTFIYATVSVFDSIIDFEFIFKEMEFCLNFILRKYNADVDAVENSFN